MQKEMAEGKIEEIDDLLNQFAAAQTLEARLAALGDLIKNRALHAARDDARLGCGLDSLNAFAANPQMMEDRLRATAALARIGTVKSLTKRTGTILSLSLEKPLPNLGMLRDPDDRYYVACALHNTRQDWIIEYAAVGIVEEKQAEKSRQELVALLFERLTSLAEVFRLLAETLKRFRPETKNPGDSVAKRLERIITAIRPQAVTVLIEPGQDAGQCLQSMLQAAFAGVGSPESQDVAEKSVEEIGGLLHDIARTQISLVADPALYAALDTPKRWFSPPEWRYIAEKSPNLQLVTRDIRDALTLLAKQGATDSNLFDQLSKASGSRDAAARITAGISDRYPELDAETSTWLKTGGKSIRRSTLGALEESRELSADAALATLMTDSSQLSEALAGISEDTRSELRLLEPGLAEPLDRLVIRCRAVLNDVDALASKRGLAFRGHKEELAEYSQAVHELIGGHVPGVRKVRILQPMIVRDSTDGAGAIVRKALVKKV